MTRYSLLCLGALIATGAGCDDNGSDDDINFPMPDGGTGGSGGSMTPATGGVSGATGGSPGTDGAAPTTGGAGGGVGTGGQPTDGGTKDAGSDGAAIDSGPAPQTCEGDGDCSPPNRYCDTDNSVCVECLTKNHCAEDEVCVEQSHTCGIACENSGDCGGNLPYCDTERGACVECLGDANCTAGARNVCDPETRTCVQCVKDDDCGPCLPLTQMPCCSAVNTCYCGLLTCLP